MPDPKVGDVVLVRVYTGLGDDRYKTYPPVAGRVVYRGFSRHGNAFGRSSCPIFTVRLLEDACKGWRRGDSVRADAGKLYPFDGRALPGQEGAGRGQLVEGQEGRRPPEDGVA